jgi:hypothetical protein
MRPLARAGSLGPGSQVHYRHYQQAHRSHLTSGDKSAVVLAGQVRAASLDHESSVAVNRKMCHAMMSAWSSSAKWPVSRMTISASGRSFP